MLSALFETLWFITHHPLNRNKKIQSIFNFLKFQIGSRLIPGAVVYNWINDTKIIVQAGETGLTGNIYCGLHEFTDMAFVLNVLTRDDLFVDVGANVGAYSILAFAAKGASGYSLEPVPATYEKLNNNLNINNINNWFECLNIGISDKEGILTFTNNKGAGNHVIDEEKDIQNIVKVKVLPLDTILDGKSPSMIKIDVEGYETPVLNGAKETLSKDSLHSVIIELNGSGIRYGFDENKILKIMYDFGFKSYRYDPFRRMLTVLNGKNPTSDNTLFIRNEKLVRERLLSTPKINIKGIEI